MDRNTAQSVTGDPIPFYNSGGTTNKGGLNPVPTTASPLVSELDRLDTHIEDLSNTLGRLHNRLKVISTVTPTPKDPSKLALDIVEGGDITRRIAQSRSRIQLLTIAVNEITDELDI